MARVISSTSSAASSEEARAWPPKIQMPFPACFQSARELDGVAGDDFYVVRDAGGEGARKDVVLHAGEELGAAAAGEVIGFTAD